MCNKIFTLVSLCFCLSLSANETNKVEILQTSEQKIYTSKLECQNKFSTGVFQNCWLSLFRLNKLVKGIEIFVDGGMSEHQHGLPTAPRIIWSEDKGVHLIQGLKFSMPGQWTLNFKVNAEDEALKDQITILFKVD